MGIRTNVINEYLMFDGKSSLDYGVIISGSGVYNSPARDIESIAIPGRNGELHIDNGRFENIKVTYPAFIVKDFEHNFNAFKAMLKSTIGYKRLEDSYQPKYYRLGLFSDELNPSMAVRNVAGSFNISFDCDPRLFLKSGEEVIEYTSSGQQIKNPTEFNSKPLIRAYGTGSVTVGGITITVNTADVYTDLNCELMEAYKGSTNCNGNITVNSYKFPELLPGLNTITFNGLSKVEITPNWWTI